MRPFFICYFPSRLRHLHKRDFPPLPYLAQISSVLSQLNKAICTDGLPGICEGLLCSLSFLKKKNLFFIGFCGIIQHLKQLPFCKVLSGNKDMNETHTQTHTPGGKEAHEKQEKLMIMRLFKSTLKEGRVHSKKVINNKKKKFSLYHLASVPIDCWFKYRSPQNISGASLA